MATSQQQRRGHTDAEFMFAGFIGAGLFFMMLAFWRSSTFGGTPDNTDTVFLIIGLLALVISTILWAMFLSPWKRFDDWSTPLYTGHEEHHAEAHHVEVEVSHSSVQQVDPHPVVHAEVQAPHSSNQQVDPHPIVHANATPTPAAEGHAVIEAPAHALMHKAAEELAVTPFSVADAAAAFAAAPAGPSVDAVRAATSQPGAASEAVAANVQAVEAVEAVEPPAMRMVQEALPMTPDASAPVSAASEVGEVVKSSQRDDLKVIEGIGPKIAEALNTAGVLTFAQVAATLPDALEKIVRDAGVRMVGKAETWPQQAKLAADGKFDELRQLQDQLTGGRQK